MSHVIIVGGGASGLVAGIFAARRNHKVTILEHKDKIGKKILATGNGKCNYTNLVQLPECYRSNDNTFPMKVLSLFGVQETIDFFCDLGIYPKEERQGYMYPNSEQASSVVQVLEMELARLKVRICLGTHVEHISKKKNSFHLTTNQGIFTADKVILATGGCASPNHGSDGSGFLLAKELGHKIIKPLPALVQLRSKEKYFKTLAGVRTDAAIGLFVNDKLMAKEEGELLIANYGVSGIPVFQISRFASKALHDGKKVALKIDFLPCLDWKETYHLFWDRIKRHSKNTVEDSFIGLLNNKLGYVLLKETGIEPTLMCEKLNKKQVTDLVNQIKEWNIPISDTNSFEQAQVCCGGVDTMEIDPTTMGSKIVEGLYLTGELMDVDGTCGGYNLQWAWTTGAVAGMHLV